MSFRWIFILAIFLLASPLLAREEVSPRDEAYYSAVQSFRDNRTKDCFRQLKAILQKDPEHPEANLLIGALYYQVEKLDKARTYFDRAGPEYLTDESAFAYGATYLEFGEYRRAVQGFRFSLRHKGPYREFAQYYLGVAYYKLGQLPRARRFFQDVDTSDFPVFLKVNRRRYLNAIREKQDKTLNSIIGTNDQRSLELSSSEPSEERVGFRVTDRNVAEDPEDIEHRNSRWRGTVRPELRLTQQSSSLENHGITHDTVDVFAHSESMQGELAYASAQDKSRFTAQMQLALGNSGYNARVEKTQFFKLDQVSGTFASQTDKKPSETAAFTHMRGNLSLGLESDWRVDVGAALLTEIPDYEAERIWGQGSVSTGIRYEGKVVEVGLEAAALRPFDENAKKDALDFAVRADLEKNMEIVRVALAAYYWETDTINFISQDRFRFTLADPSLRYRIGFKSEIGASGSTIFQFGDFSLLLKGEYFDRTISAARYVNRISSIDDIETAADGGSKFLTSLSYPIWDSFTLFGSFGYNVLTAYLYTDREKDGTFIKDYLTDVEQMIYRIGSHVSFTDWLRLSGSYALTSNSYAEKSAKTLEFKKGNPDYSEDSVFYLEMAKSF